MSRHVTIDLDDPVGAFDALAREMAGRERARWWVENLRTVARLERPTLVDGADR